MPASQLLADPSHLLAALNELVEWSETLDFAYAWVHSAGDTMEAWCALDDAKIRRAVVGVHFGGTEPFALEYFNDAIPGRVRVIEDRGGTFHPKVIVGRCGSKRRAIIGSSNFTPGGFGANTELNVRAARPIEERVGEAVAAPKNASHQQPAQAAASVDARNAQRELG